MHSLERPQGRRADFRLPTTTFRHNEGDFFAGQLPLGGLGHRQLGIVQRVPRLGHDGVVDGQHLLAQRLRRRVEQGLRLAADALGHGGAEGVEVAGDVLYAVKAVRLAGGRAGDGDAAPQVFLGFEAHRRPASPAGRSPPAAAGRPGR